MSRVTITSGAAHQDAIREAFRALIRRPGSADSGKTANGAKNGRDKAENEKTSPTRRPFSRPLRQPILCFFSAAASKALRAASADFPRAERARIANRERGVL
ncbi:hypothetical protein KM043_016446 [Ampulex compressa]|nr:hypothetical protein KM043_016446 [Ampulex compressa]